LGSGDGAVVQVRRCLLGAVREFLDNKTPSLAQHDNINYSEIRPLSAVFEGEPKWKDML